MATVDTVRGAIDQGRLGTTLMHEHVFVLNTEVMLNYPQTWDEDLRVDDAVTRLEELRSRGVDTIVDPTVIGLGRYIPRIQRVAEGTRINIVVATGLYTYNELPFSLQHRGPGTLLDGPEPMVEMFVRDITEGIAGTGVKAGVIKCATDEPGLTPGVERVLRAVARAHRQTGAPITTHTHAGTRRGLDQVRVFREEGVTMSRVVIGHCGDTTDVAYLEQLIEAGAYIGMDRFGVDALLPFEDRVGIVATMCERGHAGRMVLSHDASCWIDWFQPIDEGMWRSLVPNWHYLHISDDVLPALRQRGVSDAQIRQMLVDNPRTVLAGEG